LLEVGRVLQMQGAKLEVDDEHSRGCLGANDVTGELERIDGGVAAHESDGSTFDRARKPTTLDEFEIEAGRGEAGTTGYQQMGDAVALGSKLQTIYRSLRQRRARAVRTAACAPPCRGNRHPDRSLGHRRGHFPADCSARGTNSGARSPTYRPFAERASELRRSSLSRDCANRRKAS
jgi:hypothetical protein